MKKIEHEQCVDLLNDFIGIKSDDGARGEKPEIIEAFIPEVHYSKTPDIYYTPQILKKIREMYYSIPKPGKCKYDIAIHIRRGDVNPGVVERYTSNEFYFNLVSTLETKYPDARICIYSLGQDEDFGELRHKKIFFCLNDSVEKTFHDLVTARILITSKSSFSYTAALLSEQEIHYMPFWHRPLSHWNVLSE
jgi:hypothetical protein